MNPLKIIAERLKIYEDWVVYITADDTKITIYHNGKGDTLLLGTIWQVSDSIHIITCWHKNIAIPLADPEIITKINQLISQDFTKFREYWPWS